MYTRVEEHIKILKALADSTRYKIVLFLLDGTKGVGEITRQVKKSQPNVSLQLKFLELSGIIKSEREGRQAFYSISNNKVRRIIKTLQHD